MADFNTDDSGALGPSGLWFSDLFYDALSSQFTGALMLKTPGDCTVFFKDGRPCAAGGAGFRTAFLGELMVHGGTVPQSVVSEALQLQGEAQGERPLLGSILVSKGADPGAIKRSIQIQTTTRVHELFGAGEGSWKKFPGENDRLRTIGVPMEPWSLLVSGLTQHASDTELRAVSDALLGKAVRLEGTLDSLEPSAALKRFLRYLEKPRKPDQLERALKRRMVRGLLRMLMLKKQLVEVPVAKAIPIPKATLLKGALTFNVSSTPNVTDPEASAPKRAPSAARPAEPAKPVKSAEAIRFEKEVKTLHGSLKETDHFSLLGIQRTTEPTELRKAFTTLAKKYHPDTFPPGLSDEIEELAREISAQLNDAHQTLINETKRAEYIAMLDDERIKGDATKAELVRNAEVQAAKGIVMLRKNDFKEARKYLKLAIEGDSSNAEYKARYAIALMSDAHTDEAKKKAQTEAYKLLQEALRLNEKSPYGHYVMGIVKKSMGDTKEAIRHFRFAVRLDPKNLQAKTELRLLSRRAHDADKSKKGGMLSKLLKR